MFYVLEFQTGANGAVIPVAYADRNEAESKYHEILMYAAKSNIPKHGAMIVTEDLFVIKSEIYNHEVVPNETVPNE